LTLLINILGILVFLRQIKRSLKLNRVDLYAILVVVTHANHASLPWILRDGMKMIVEVLVLLLFDLELLAFIGPLQPDGSVRLFHEHHRIRLLIHLACGCLLLYNLSGLQVASRGMR
jgi:hypothetical protein